MATDPDHTTDEWDMPLGGITARPRLVYKRTHIEVAVAEIRFLRSCEEITESEAAHIWERLGRDQFPIFEPHKQQVFNVTITATGAEQVTDIQQGWLLASSDRSSAVTLLPSTVVIQTQAYDHYSTSLGDQLAAVLPLFVEATGVSRVQRLGLRYINRLTDPEASTPMFWRDHIDPSFAGSLGGSLGDLVVGQHQQVQLGLDPTSGARIQSGLIEEPGNHRRFSFLVDIDVYREQTSDYAAAWCANQCRQLNRTAFAIFTNILSDEYLETLGPATPQGHEEGRAQ